jgi:PiT family inorganic phosphate transporter
MGVGTSDRFNAVRWGVARSIITAWILTIPASALIAAVAYFGLHMLSGPIAAVLRIFGV